MWSEVLDSPGSSVEDGTESLRSHDWYPGSGLGSGTEPDLKLEEDAGVGLE